MSEKKVNILFVANLQVFSTPFASLYLDVNRNVLCVLVRISSPLSNQIRYAVSDVTCSLIMQYLNKQIGLRTIFANSEGICAQIHNNEVFVESKKRMISDHVFSHADYFDPEYCEDSTKLKFFLKRFEKKQTS